MRLWRNNQKVSMRRKSRDSSMSSTSVKEKFSIGVVKFYNNGVRGSGRNVRLSHLLIW